LRIPKTLLILLFLFCVQSDEQIEHSCSPGDMIAETGPRFIFPLVNRTVWGFPSELVYSSSHQGVQNQLTVNRVEQHNAVDQRIIFRQR